MKIGTEEGDLCDRKGCHGVLEYPLVENCSCHISSPCYPCTDNRLACMACGWVLGDEYEKGEGTMLTKEELNEVKDRFHIADVRSTA